MKQVFVEVEGFVFLEGRNQQTCRFCYFEVFELDFWLHLELVFGRNFVVLVEEIQAWVGVEWVLTI